MSFLVTALVALAAAGTVLGAAFYFGLINTSGGGGTAAASPTPRGSFVAASIGPSSVSICDRRAVADRRGGHA